MKQGSWIHRHTALALGLLGSLAVAAVAAVPLSGGLSAAALACQGAALPVYLLAAVLGYVAVPMATARLLRPYLSAHDSNGAARIAMDCAILAGIAGAVTGILLTLLAPVLASVSGLPEAAPAMRNSGLMLFVLPLSGALRGWLWAAESYAAAGCSLLLPRLLFSLIGGIGFGGEAAAWSGGMWTAMFLAELLTLIGMAALFAAQVRLFWKKTDVNPMMAIAGRFGSLMTVFTGAFLPFAFAAVSDLLIVPARFVPEVYAQAARLENFGAYSGAMCAMLFTAVLAFGLSFSCLHGLTDELRRGEKRRFQARVSLAQKFGFAVALPLAVLLGVLAKPVLQLFFGMAEGEVLNAVAAAGAYLVPGAALGALSVLCAAILCQLGHGVIAAVHGLLFFPLKLALNALLATAPGILSGAAVSTSLAMLACTACHMVQLARLTRAVPAPVNGLVKPVFAAACMGAAVYVLYFGLMAPTIGPAGLLIAAVLGLLVYFALMAATKAFTPAEYAGLPFGEKIRSLLHRSGM